MGPCLQSSLWEPVLSSLFPLFLFTWCYGVVLQMTAPQWQNMEQREAYQRLVETVAVLHRLTTRLSSRAEIVGAVRQVLLSIHSTPHYLSQDAVCWFIVCISKVFFILSRDNWNACLAVILKLTMKQFDQCHGWPFAKQNKHWKNMFLQDNSLYL